MPHRSLDHDADVGPGVIRLNQLLRAKGTKPSELAEACAALRDSPSHVAAVPLLLKMSRHASEAVRIGAVRGMASHPLPAAMKRLVELEKDPRPKVREEVERTEAAIDALPVACLNCGECDAQAKVFAEPSGDPEAPIDVQIHPVFCDDACAREWALETFREEVRGGGWHFCAVEMRWAAGKAEECATCVDSEAIDEATPEDEA